MDLVFVSKIFNAYANLTTLPWVGIPLAIFIWSFIKSSTYHQDNSAFHRNIRDVLDQQAFKKIIVPLFSYIDENLTQEIFKDSSLETMADRGELFKMVEAKKKAILGQRDFTYLESAIEFQDVIEKILKSRKNQLTFRNFVKGCKSSLIYLTIFSATTLSLGIVWVYFQNVSQNEKLSSVFCILWIISLVISLVFGLLYYFKKIKIDGLIDE